MIRSASVTSDASSTTPSLPKPLPNNPPSVRVRKPVDYAGQKPPTHQKSLAAATNSSVNARVDRKNAFSASSSPETLQSLNSATRITTQTKHASTGSPLPLSEAPPPSKSSPNAPPLDASTNSISSETKLDHAPPTTEQMQARSESFPALHPARTRPAPSTPADASWKDLYQDLYEKSCAAERESAAALSAVRARNSVLETRVLELQLELAQLKARALAPKLDSCDSFPPAGINGLEEGLQNDRLVDEVMNMSRNIKKALKIPAAVKPVSAEILEPKKPSVAKILPQEINDTKTPGSLKKFPTQPNSALSSSDLKENNENCKPEASAHREENNGDTLAKLDAKKPQQTPNLTSFKSSDLESDLLNIINFSFDI